MFETYKTEPCSSETKSRRLYVDEMVWIHVVGPRDKSGSNVEGFRGFVRRI